MNIHSKKINKGFTLIEALMAIMLVAVLSTIAITQYINFTKDAKDTVTRQKLTVIKLAIVGDARLVAGGAYSKPGYKADCQGNLPTTMTDLGYLPDGLGAPNGHADSICFQAYDPLLKQGWRGPYLDISDSNWNKDAWGTTIVISGSTVTSCGPDLICGGGNSADDITYSF